MKKDIFLCCLFALLCLLNLYDGYGNYSSPPIYREDRNHRAVKDYNVGYDPPLFPSSISILKNDTVFCYIFSADTVLESICLNYYSVKKKVACILEHLRMEVIGLFDIKKNINFLSMR